MLLWLSPLRPCTAAGFLAPPALQTPTSGRGAPASWRPPTWRHAGATLRRWARCGGEALTWRPPAPAATGRRCGRQRSGGGRAVCGCCEGWRVRRSSSSRGERRSGSSRSSKVGSSRRDLPLGHPFLRERQQAGAASSCPACCACLAPHSLHCRFWRLFDSMQSTQAGQPFSARRASLAARAPAGGKRRQRWVWLRHRGMLPRGSWTPPLRLGCMQIQHLAIDSTRRLQRAGGRFLPAGRHLGAAPAPSCLDPTRQRKMRQP